MPPPCSRPGRHLLHALREFEISYNGHGPHQGIANARPLGAASERGHRAWTARTPDQPVRTCAAVASTTSRLDAAWRTIEDAFVALILDAEAGPVIDGPVARVALSYYRSDALSFEIHAATEDERLTLAATDAQAAWSPADFEAGTDVNLDDAPSVRLVRQELALLNADDVDTAAGSEVGRRLLCAVAARLNLHDWSDTLPVADDFVVYPVDLELVDLERNLADCLPPDRFARLRERGLL